MVKCRKDMHMQVPLVMVERGNPYRVPHISYLLEIMRLVRLHGIRAPWVFMAFGRLLGPPPPQPLTLTKVFKVEYGH